MGLPSCFCPSIQCIQTEAGRLSIVDTLSENHHSVLPWNTRTILFFVLLLLPFKAMYPNRGWKGGPSLPPSLVKGESLFVIVIYHKEHDTPSGVIIKVHSTFSYDLLRKPLKYFTHHRNLFHKKIIFKTNCVLGYN